MSKNDYEEYCEECGKDTDKCDCEEEYSISEILDGANKGLDFVKKLKDLATPPPQPRPRVNFASMMAAQGIERQMAAEKAEKERNRREKLKEEQEHRKWKINLAVKIGVPITIAIISGLTYLVSIS